MTKKQTIDRYNIVSKYMQNQTPQNWHIMVARILGTQKELIASLSEVVNYMHADERKDWEAATQPDKHIYHDIHRLALWLDALKGGDIVHELRIQSLDDAQAECPCGWSITYTGFLSRDELLAEYKKHL